MKNVYPASPCHTRKRSGNLNPLVLVLIVGACLVVLLIALLPQGNRPGNTKIGSRQEPLVMLVAAGMRPPVEKVLEKYRDEYGVEVVVQYGGSNMLLNQLKVNKFEQPDLYLAADAFYTAEAVAEGLAQEVLGVARQEPVVAFRRDRALTAKSWQDLLTQDLRWSVPDPDQAAIGRTIKRVLQGQTAGTGESTLWEQLEEQTVKLGVFKPTVNESANDIKIGAVDVGIIWSSTVAGPEYRDELTSISLSELLETAKLEEAGDLVSVAVLTSSRNPTAALKLARYLTARDRGLPFFEEIGMRSVEGDVWAEIPEINFFCGAVNRRAIEPVIDAFQKREGVIINTVFDGCGILTSRMGTIENQSQQAGFPDVYMACDRYYLDNVQSWFQDDLNVSQTEIVLVVPKGSQQVRTLEDLLKPGIRVALGEPDQCTIGALTRRLLRQAGLYEQLKEKQQQAGEVVVEKSSSALIVPDILTGHVDAAIAYRNDTLDHTDKVDLLKIESPLTQAIQPLSIAKGSQHKQLVRRLYHQVRQAQKSFESVGFEFLLTEPVSAP